MRAATTTSPRRASRSATTGSRGEAAGPLRRRLPQPRSVTRFGAQCHPSFTVINLEGTLAVLTGEQSAEAIARLLRARGGVAAGAPSLVETAMVLAGRSSGGPAQAEADLARLLARFDVAVVPFTDAHWRVALDAFARFGKGRHPAALNLGDCLTYAVARLSGRPLLCVGGDFAQTDLQLVPLPS